MREVADVIVIFSSGKCSGRTTLGGSYLTGAVVDKLFSRGKDSGRGGGGATNSRTSLYRSRCSHHRRYLVSSSLRISNYISKLRKSFGILINKYNLRLLLRNRFNARKYHEDALMPNILATLPGGINDRNHFLKRNSF